MSRLLFAAARGARLDRLGHITKTWVTDGANYEAIQLFPDDFRVHPEDEALQYGAISTALRDAAVSMPVWLQDVNPWVTTAAEEALANNELGYAWANWQHVEEIHKSLFLLILSEALADDGL